MSPAPDPRRVGNRVVAGAALVLLSPILAVLAIAVRLRLGSPVLFRQARAGLSGEPFTLVKFRTMTDLRGVDGMLAPDAARMHPFGSWLRSTSLDELPELWNIARGEMAFVGPRPLPTTYLDRYSPEQMRRHDVLPGLTGHAQVNGRNATTWDERFELDLWYVDHRSWHLDLRILARTAMVVVRRSGVSADGEATMTEFRGGAPD